MKIEKVNENQIRCTLTKQDLADRQINLRELAYGSEKAKGLFHDMIQQANYEFGFDVSDNPLMVEAIPLSSESLVLLITKVEYPEELDTRFSQFTEAGDEELFSNTGAVGNVERKGADDILELFQKIRISSAVYLLASTFCADKKIGMSSLCQDICQIAFTSLLVTLFIIYPGARLNCYVFFKKGNMIYGQTIKF